MCKEDAFGPTLQPEPLEKPEPTLNTQGDQNVAKLADSMLTTQMG